MLFQNILDYVIIIIRTKWAQLEGVRYSTSCIVVLSTDSLNPIFGQIIDILLINIKQCLLVCEVLETEGFDEHYHAYVVTKQTPTPLTFCKQSDLSDFHTLGVYKHKGEMFIVPKYHLL